MKIFSNKAFQIVLAIFFIGLPFIINYLLTYGLNGWYPIITVVGYGEWLNFWGAYFVFLATIFLGIRSLEISNVMTTLSNQANQIQKRLVKIEEDKKKPFLVPDLSKKLNIEIGRELFFGFPQKHDVVYFRVTNSPQQQKIALVKIDFSIANKTEMLISNIELIKANIKFLGVEHEQELKFEEYCPPVNLGKVINKSKKISVVFGSASTYNDLDLNLEKISAIWFRLEFRLTNIYKEQYGNKLEILSALKNQGEYLEGIPTLVETELDTWPI